MDTKRKLTADQGAYLRDTKKERLEFGVVEVPNFETAIEFTAPEDLGEYTDPLGVKSAGTTKDLELKIDPEFNQNVTLSPEHNVCEKIEVNENLTHIRGEPHVGECESMITVDEKPSLSQVSLKQPLPSPGTSSTPSSVNSCTLAESEASSSSVTITSLLEHPFTSGFWKVRQQDGILTQPIPLSRRYLVRETWYERFGSYPWLCESDELERYFCWPCLLYDNPQNVWSAVSTTALRSNLNLQARFEEALVDHQTTTHHQKAESLYMRKSKITNAVNMELWKCLVQTVFSARQNNAKTMYSAEYESKIKPMMEYFFNKKITPKLACTLSKVILEIALQHMKNRATEGVQKAQYVALHIEDLASVVADESWLVAIARYADQDGRIHDRVIDFIKVSTTKANRTEHVAVDWIRPFLEKCTLNDNVIGLSYSATLVSPKNILLFNNSLMKWCPRALFFHPPSHRFYKSLFQAMSHYKTCRTYLQELHSMRIFLSKFTTMSEVPTLLDENFPRTVKTHLRILRGILNRVASCQEYKERREAKGYLLFLSKVDSRFMMTLLDLICSSVEDIAAAVEGPWIDWEWSSDLKCLTVQRDVALKNLKIIASRGFDVIAKDGLLADAKSHYAASKQKYQSHITVIVRFAADMLMQRFEKFDAFRSTRPDLVNCCIKDSQFISALFGKRLNLSDSELSKLESFIKPHPLNENGTYAELLGWLTTEKKQEEFPLLYKYLLFAHTISRDKSAFGNLLNSVYKLTENKFLPKLTRACLDGYFWLAEDVLAIVEDPEFHHKALKACQNKVDEM